MACRSLRGVCTGVLLILGRVLCCGWIRLNSVSELPTGSPKFRMDLELEFEALFSRGFEPFIGRFVN